MACRTLKPAPTHEMNVSTRITVLVAVVAATTAAGAHHGSADYHVDREQVVRGVVAEWRWSSPHTWIVVTVTTPAGRTEAWEGEGPPLTWAAGRGWSSTTLRTGETVALVMYPSRRRERAGLVKRIDRADGDVLHVSRPWLDK
jgi:hypothetical protein